MSRESGHFKEFGKFRLDAEKKVLWCGHEPVELPLKEIELLCVLTETSEVIGKEELLNRVWADSFVEESNLSRHIYRLRKAFKKYGESEDLIQTVPKRGYRFTGEVHETQYGTLAIEKHSISRTLVEEIEDSIEPNRTALPQAKPKQFWIPIVASFDVSFGRIRLLLSLPGSLDESLNALEADHEFLLKGDVFTTAIIDRWIGYKRENEITPLRLRPHPLEFSMYYDI